jgi:hypothetical protein
MKLSTLPGELLHHVLTFVEPSDLPALCKSGPDLYNFIHGNRVLFQSLYLQRLVCLSLRVFILF